MSALFEELAARDTDMGEISLRRRRDPTLGLDLYEVKLDDEFLMSSLFTVAEVELARLGLAAVEGDNLEVVVGGLGLGYTAVAVLDDPRVASLTVVEALEDVIDWHERALLPEVRGLTHDPRTRLVPGDFFAMVRGAERAAMGPSGDAASGQAASGEAASVDAASGQAASVDAVLVDIDHSPRHHLHPSHADFYTASGLERVAGWLRPGGVFALWSDDAPDPAFETELRGAFTESRAHVVRFSNPLTGGESANTVYVARRA